MATDSDEDLEMHRESSIVVSLASLSTDCYSDLSTKTTLFA